MNSGSRIPQRTGRPGATPVGRGGAASNTSSSRSYAAIQAQERLRALMAQNPSDSLDEDVSYSAPSQTPQSRHMPAASRQPIGTGGRKSFGSPSVDGSDGPGSYTLGGFGDSRRGDPVVPSKQEVESLKREAAKLRDDIDVLSEENEYLLDKLRMAEEELKETQARAQVLEKQVATLGEGVTLEARLLNKKEQALKQREAMLKAAKEQTRDVKEVEIASLRLEIEAHKEEAATAMDMARQAAEEVRLLRQMTARLVLTPEEKEEVVLKRCWLARYWLLAVRHGVQADIAGPQSEHWHKLAPLPVEVVVAAGQKAKEETLPAGDGDAGAVDGLAAGLKDLTASADSNIESMFQVERGLRDLASLKVEEGVLLAMAQHRRPALLRVAPSATSGTEGPRLAESMELSDEEVEDVQFKQNWLVYFWRRAKRHGVEPDIAGERVEYWVQRTTYKPTAHDAVDAERGLMELRKLGVEQQLWDVARKELVAEDAAKKAPGENLASPLPGAALAADGTLTGQ